MRSVTVAVAALVFVAGVIGTARVGGGFDDADLCVSVSHTAPLEVEWRPEVQSFPCADAVWRR